VPRFWNCEKQIFFIVEIFFIGFGIFCLRGTTGGLPPLRFTLGHARIFHALRRTSAVVKAARRPRAVPAGLSNPPSVLKAPRWPRAGASDPAGGHPGVPLGHLSESVAGPILPIFWPFWAASAADIDLERRLARLLCGGAAGLAPLECGGAIRARWWGL
jgi:hypothetical protein